MLNGKPQSSFDNHNLNGNISKNISNSKINNLIMKINKLFINPIENKDWIKFKENKPLLEKYENDLNKLKFFGSNNDIDSYLNIIFLLKNINKNSTSSNNQNNLTTFVYRISNINIKPEYNIYHELYGKPNLLLKEKYNEENLNFIRNQLILTNKKTGA